MNILSDPILIWTGLAFILLLLIAAVLELLRRRQMRYQFVNAQWRVVKKIAEEKALSESEWQYLAELLKRNAPESPLKAVTVRQHFDECVVAEIRKLEGDSEKMAIAGLVLRDIRTHLGLDYIPLGQRIYSSRDLHVGQLVWLSEAAEVKPAWFRARIVEVDEAFFRVEPVDDMARLPHPYARGQQIRCRLWREEDARYLFSITVECFDLSPVSWQLRHADQINRMQARAYYRVRYDQPTTITGYRLPEQATLEDALTTNPAVRCRGRITNLSAGGLALVTQNDILERMLIRFLLEIPGERRIEPFARVVATAPLSGGRYLIRAMFCEMTEDTRDFIARYVMRRQQFLNAQQQDDQDASEYAEQ
jgi:hypothetical protein